MGEVAFFHSFKDQCVSNQTDTENAWKRNSDLGAWWGFDLPDLTANEYNSESPVSFGHVPCDETARPHQPRKEIATTILGMFPNRIKANTLWDLEEDPTLQSPQDFSICVSLTVFRYIRQLEGRGIVLYPEDLGIKQLLAERKVAETARDWQVLLISFANVKAASQATAVWLTYSSIWLKSLILLCWDLFPHSILQAMLGLCVYILCGRQILRCPKMLITVGHICHE